jgi:excisionase family DNA binding protein
MGAEQRMSELKDINTLQEAADWLQMHYMTLQRMVKKGDLPAIKIAGRWKITREALEGLFK